MNTNTKEAAFLYGSVVVEGQSSKFGTLLTYMRADVELPDELAWDAGIWGMQPMCLEIESGLGIALGKFFDIGTYECDVFDIGCASRCGIRFKIPHNPERRIEDEIDIVVSAIMAAIGAVVRGMNKEL